MPAAVARIGRRARQVAAVAEAVVATTASAEKNGHKNFCAVAEAVAAVEPVAAASKPRATSIALAARSNRPQL